MNIYLIILSNGEENEVYAKNMSDAAHQAELDHGADSIARITQVESVHERNTNLAAACIADTTEVLSEQDLWAMGLPEDFNG